MPNPSAKVAAYLDSCADRLAETLSALVRIPTVNPYSGDPDPSGEAAGQEFAAEHMQALGGQTRFIPVPEDVYERAGILGPKNRDWTNRQSLVGNFTFGSGKTRIVLNGHMDTIGASDYQGEPFSGRVKDGVVHGRGASDCKSGIVAGLFAIEALQQCGAELDCEILFESVVDEECNGAGAGTLACCHAGVRGDYCIVLDGQAGLVYPGCQGICTVDITVTGRAGHGSLGGVNAIEKLLVAKGALDRLAAERAEARSGTLVNVGVLRAGIAPWVVPNSGHLSANINYDYDEAEQAERAGEGFSGALVRRRLEELLAEACSGDEWLCEHAPVLTWAKDVPPYRLSDGGEPARCEALLGAVTEAFRCAWGSDPSVSGLPAWCDASHLSRAGGMPTVGMGAGQSGTAHTSTEHNMVSNVVHTATAIALAVVKLSGVRKA
jgi:acetylornithine deacetylase